MYDVTVIGAGVSGLFAAYSLIKTSNMKILLIEKGLQFEKRLCPIKNKKRSECLNCKVCHRLCGFGGLGKSEGKFNYTNDFGGKLGNKIGNKLALNLMKKVDEILCSFGADEISLYNTYNEELINEARKYGIEILSTKVRHLGTEMSKKIIKRFYNYLKDDIDFEFSANILDIEKDNNFFKLYFSDKLIKTKKLVVATGISGGKWFENLCDKFNIVSTRSRIDIGIRVEMKRSQLDYILKDNFETKLRYKGNDFEATTYCMNPNGNVIKKYQDGLILADGQNYLEGNSPSENLNFTIFIPRYFKSKKEARDYATKIIKDINQDRNRILLQRYGDLKQNRESTEGAIKNNSIIPTLNGEIGNLYDGVPNIYIYALLKIFSAIEKLTGDKISNDTLLYGVDAKFYESEIDTSYNFETNVKGLYFIGDCSGTTWSLAQAAASGLYFGMIQ